MKNVLQSKFTENPTVGYFYRVRDLGLYGFVGNFIYYSLFFSDAFSKLLIPALVFIRSQRNETVSKKKLKFLFVAVTIFLFRNNLSNKRFI